MSTLLVLLSLIDVALLIIVLLVYLNWVAGLLNKIDEGLATTVDLVQQIVGHAEPIIPGLQQINRIFQLQFVFEGERRWEWRQLAMRLPTRQFAQTQSFGPQPLGDP